MILASKTAVLPFLSHQSLPGNLDNSVFQYQKDQKFPCLWRDKKGNTAVFEAKIIDLRIKPKTDQVQYRIHYDGWNKRYDEWVGPEQIDVDENGDKKSVEGAATTNHHN